MTMPGIPPGLGELLAKFGDKWQIELLHEPWDHWVAVRRPEPTAQRIVADLTPMGLFALLTVIEAETG